jgi:tetratricopeptide (TPR) repeat protein
MHSYGVADVERLLGLSRATLRALVASGFVSPERGPRNSLRFSFQDLIVLRTAQALAGARVKPRRIAHSLRELRRQLPETMPLSGLRIGAEGDRVVVREGSTRWQAESGQYLLEFEGDPAAGSLNVIAPSPPAAVPADTSGDFARALEAEKRHPAAAMEAYRAIIARDPAHLDARLNLGLLLHEAGRLDESLRAYDAALQACGPDAVLFYNIAVLFEDLAQPARAMQAYRAAIAGDPAMADAHYNLALLFRASGRAKEALRHMSEYRRLTR